MRSSRARSTSALNSRTTVVGGLTAVLLPLTLATPALTGTASAATAASAAAIPATAAMKSTALRISVPRGTVAPGAQRVGVRLVGDGRLVRGATVNVQRRSGSTWVSAGSVRTDRVGHAVARVPLTRNTVVRAVFRGTAASPASVTREAAVVVRRPTASLRAGASWRSRAVQIAARQVGKPYRWGSTGPSSFDCSGLVNYAFRAVGKAVPRTSGQLRAATKRVSKSAAQPGDLIFSPGHVGIYAGNGKMVDAPGRGRSVTVRRIYTSNYSVGRIA